MTKESQEPAATQEPATIPAGGNQGTGVGTSAPERPQFNPAPDNTNISVKTETQPARPEFTPLPDPRNTSK